MSQQIPLKKVTLYNNGLASFERVSKEVKGEVELVLFFKNSTYDDVTKSISFTAVPCSENGSCDVKSISYQNTKEADKLTIDIPNSTPLTGLLENLKGSSVTLSFHGRNETVTGILLGVEEQMDTTNKVSVPTLTVYTNKSSLQTFELSTTSGIKFNDQNIQDSIQHSLESYISQRNKDLFKLSVYTHGHDQYLVKANYNLMSKPWKPSYRFKFSNKEYSKGVIECLALIENDQEEDYENVILTLVTGSPSSVQETESEGSILINFKATDGSFSLRFSPTTLIDLVKRRVSQQKGISYFSVKLVFAGKVLEEGRTLSDYNIENGSSVMVARNDNASASDDVSSNKSFRIATTHNLSFFPIECPINVKRNQRAMISFLKKELDVKPVLLFNENIKKGNPLSSIVFQNNTGYVLEEGSIVFRDERDLAVGEATLSQMWNQDETLVPISIQLGIEVLKDFNTSQTKYHYISIKNGTISLYRYKKLTVSYLFDNKSCESFSEAFIDHMFIDGWDLDSVSGFDCNEPVDITDRFYRLRGSIDPKEKKKFMVTEKAIHIETIDISRLTLESLEDNKKYINNEESIIALKESVRMANESSEIMKRIYDIDTEIRECKENQSRLRSNIDVLKSNVQQQAKYVTELSKTDDYLVEMYSAKKKLEEEKILLNRKYSIFVNNIVYEGDINLP